MYESLTWPVIAFCFAAVVLAIMHYGYDAVRHPAWLVALLLVPVWYRTPLPLFNSTLMDPRTAVGLALLGAWLLRPSASALPFRWMLSDTLIVLLFLLQMTSQMLNGLFVPFAPVELARELILPYVLGRLFLQSWADVGRILPVMCLVALVLSLYCIFEAVTKLHPLAEVVGKRWVILDGPEGFRWGLKRSQGITNHPIYMGLVLSMLLPWLIIAFREAYYGQRPGWWMLVLPLASFAAIVTVSRAAQLAVAGVYIGYYFLRRPNQRLNLTVVALVLMIPLVLFRQEVIDMLSKFVGEEDASTAVVVINGREYQYSGTRHRDLLSIVYEDAANQTGWFGYGPPLVDVPLDPNMDERFKSIDNHYLIQLLSYGYAGLIGFVLLSACGIGFLLREAWDPRIPHSILAAGLCGAFTMVFLAMRGVSMESDYAWVWLFTLGIAARLRIFRKDLEEYGVY